MSEAVNNEKELVIKWKPLIEYLEHHQKDPEKVLNTFKKLEDVVHFWNEPVEEPSLDRSSAMELHTLTRKKSFYYKGSVTNGTTILFGQNRYATVTAEQYKELLQHFRGRTVLIGTSFTYPPSNSMGAWLLKHVSSRALASYIAPILIKEGYAKLNQNSTTEIIFK